MILKQFTICILSIFLIACTQAQSASQTVLFEDEDVEIFEQFINFIAPYKNADSETLLKNTALFFLGKPYVPYTLEVTDEEMLIVNLRGFDCVTFVETVIALARTAIDDNPTFETYLYHLQNIRYRDGIIDGYESRLHYTSDWVYENERRGFVRNISSDIPGSDIQYRTINFMSSNRHLYRHLIDDDAMLFRIVTIENEINRRGGFSFIPTEQIASVAHYIPNMAMVAFTTSIRGLDVQHVGFTFWDNDRLTFIHASTSVYSVVIQPRTLAEYCEAMRTVTGVMVVEILL